MAAARRLGGAPVMLRCAVCLHKPPGDRDITAAEMAITVMGGLAVCEEHVDWLSLPDSVVELLLNKPKETGRD